MKTKNAASRPIPTAAQLKKQRVRRVSCIILRIRWCFPPSCLPGSPAGAADWAGSAVPEPGSNWPMSFVGYGQMLLVGSGLLTLGTVLVLLCRKNWLNWAAAGSAAGGVVLCLLALYHVASYAKEHSFYSQLMQMPAATLYCVQILPVILPFVCVTALGLLQFFSPEAVQRRRSRKLADSAKAPSIL